MFKPTQGIAIFAFTFVTALSPNAAYAFPDGAPWGSADPSAANNCASCHFDGEVSTDSDAVSISMKGLNGKFNQPVDFYLQFRNPENKKTGFQIMASAGKFTSTWNDIEVDGGQARSISPRDNSSWLKLNGIDGATSAVMWKFQWTPPAILDGDVTFLIAVNESNDDQSAFGDIIHIKTETIPMPGDFWLLPPL